MARISITFFALLAAFSTTTVSLPLRKRIAQTTIDAPKTWEDACNAAGGAQQCNSIAVAAAATLLAAAGPCEQQDSGDAMVALAKQLNNDAAMITAAQIFIQQPRNTPTSLATPYCQTAPANEELAGFFQCQFQGADQVKFAGGAAVGASGTVPLGLSAPLSPPGSCPANPSGPIADGTQLSAQISSPGTPATATGLAGGSGASNSTGSIAGGADESGDDCGDGTATVAQTVSTLTATSAVSGATTTAKAATTTPMRAAAPASAPSSSASPASAGAGDFKLKNGLDAQKQNLDSLALKATDACSADGAFACIGGAIMQCANGAFVSMGNCAQSAAPGTSCFFLPFVAKKAVSAPSCVDAATAEARIAASGATGGIFGDGKKAQGTVQLSA